MSENGSDYDVIAVNRWTRQALLNTDESVDIKTFHDEDGDVTDNVEEASFAVAELPNGRWILILLSNFNPVTTM